MFKFIYIVLIVFFFSACSSSKFNSVNNYIDLSKEKKQYTNARCSNNSYIINSTSLEYGNIFIENINLDNSCLWNGFSRSYFDDLFKEKIKVKSIQAIERIDFENFEFSTYLINDKYIMNLIFSFSSNQSTFTIDYNGVLFTKMIKSFDKNYVNKYLERPRFSSSYNSSLVNRNIIERYFSPDTDYE